LYSSVSKFSALFLKEDKYGNSLSSTNFFKSGPVRILLKSTFPSFVLIIAHDDHWYSLFNTVAVILPPKLTASEIVTKSPTTAPWLLSVAVIVVLPSVAAKVIPLVVVALIGVIS